MQETTQGIHCLDSINFYAHATFYYYYSRPDHKFNLIPSLWGSSSLQYLSHHHCPVIGPRLTMPTISALEQTILLFSDRWLDCDTNIVCEALEEEVFLCDVQWLLSVVNLICNYWPILFTSTQYSYRPQWQCLSRIDRETTLLNVICKYAEGV